MRNLVLFVRRSAMVASVLILAQSLSTPPMTPSVEAASLALLGVFPDDFQAAPPPTPTAVSAVKSVQPDVKRVKADEPTVVPQDERLPVPVQVIKQMAWLKEGQLIALERKSPQTLNIGGKMKFVATLINHTGARLNLVAEVVVRKGDGSKETLIPGYALQLGKGNRFRVPVGLAAKAQRFPPGLTQFSAYLWNRQGQLIDQASITFMVSLPLQ